MRLLDLFCGAGGAAMGYYRAGFMDIVGVDNKPQPHYPFEFVQADALEYLAEYWKMFDLIHTSPPCQEYTSINVWKRKYPDLIAPTRELLQQTGKPYVIENVRGAPLENPIMLCGTMFGLRVVRHRYFECSPPILLAPATCNHWLPVVKHGRRPDREKQFAAVTGHFSDVEYAKRAMGIDWMTQAELSQAIPPAYTEWIGRRIVEVEAGTHSR